MKLNKFPILIFLSVWICSANSCNDCCYSRQTTNCCPTTSCCSPCSSCTTVPCLKNCKTECSTTPRRPESETDITIREIPVISPQITPQAPSQPDTNNHVSNLNNVNASSKIDINNTLTNTNSIHVPINITNTNMNNIRVDSSGSTRGGSFPQPVIPPPQGTIPPTTPLSPQGPKFIFFVIRQPPVNIPQQPVPIPQQPVPLPQQPVQIPQPVYIPQQIPIMPSFFPSGCCGVQPMGCCSIQPRCSYQQCQPQCSSFC